MSFPCIDNLMLDTGLHLEDDFNTFYIHASLWSREVFNLGNI